LPQDVRLASLLTLVEVDATDPAFANPTKPIGPMYAQDEADTLAAEKGWAFKPDADGFRRVVPSPQPQRIYGLDPVRWLLEHGCVVICAGGGGIPVMHTDEPAPAGRRLVGIEAVIDKDLASALLAIEIEADALVIATDVDAVYADWGTPDQHPIRLASPHELAASEFAEGSMGPKVKAACLFAERTGRRAVIGSTEDIEALLAGTAGTTVQPELARTA